MKRTVLFALPAIFFFSMLAHAEWEARVVDVFDGDTLILSRGGRAQIISLFGIDCPEKEQPFGLEAKDFTRGMVVGKSIEVMPVKRGQYEMCKVYVGDRSLNQELLKAGYAWHHKKYSTDEEWAKIEQSARSSGMGLWAKESPVPPWEFTASKYRQTSQMLDRPYTIRLPIRHGALSSPEVIRKGRSTQPRKSGRIRAR